MDAGLYNRYENGRRPPTLGIIIGFHILFGASVDTLFPERLERIQKRIVARSTKLIEQLQTEPSPKSTNRIGYIQNIVNELNNTRHE